MKIEPRRPRARAVIMVAEWLIVTALCALWLLVFFGVIYLLALAAVHL